MIALVGELLFQCELERMALLTPEEDLKRKAATFETSVAKFKSERQRLADLLAMDCKQLLKDLNAKTDCVWSEARRELHQLVNDISDFSTEPIRARERITTNLSRYFVIALEDSVRSFQVKLDERLCPSRPGRRPRQLRASNGGRSNGDLCEMPQPRRRSSQGVNPIGSPPSLRFLCWT